MIAFQLPDLIDNFGPDINCATMRAFIDIPTPRRTP